ncbi:MAG: hypothetical protein ACM3QZ_06770 [Solirubrobacterales bacterium]
MNDSRFEAMILRDQLTLLGYETRTADEYAAIRVVETFQPDILIANRLMSTISGEEFIRRAKAVMPHLKGVVDSCSPIGREMVSKAVDATFQTPIKKEELARILLSLFETSDQKATEATADAAVSSLETFEAAAQQASSPEPPAAEPGPVAPAPEPVHPEPVPPEPATDHPQFQFCPFCGQSLQTAAFHFCPFCGKKLQ